MEQEKPNHRIKIVPLRNRPGLCGPAAAWFSGKWGIPEAEYRRSMEGMLQKSAAVPQWYGNPRRARGNPRRRRGH